MDPNQLNTEPQQHSNNLQPEAVPPKVIIPTASPVQPVSVVPTVPNTPASAPVMSPEPFAQPQPLPHLPQQPVPQSPAIVSSVPPAPNVFIGNGGNNPVQDTKNLNHNPDDSTYISNPFLNATRGLVLTLSNNPKPALLCAFLNFIGIVVGYILLFILAAAAGAIGGFIGFIVLLFVAIVSIGTFYVIGGASAKSEIITTSDAYRKSVKKFFPFLGLTIISAIMIIIGFILLIIPGFIVLARISLASIVMFEENLGPINAIKRSFSLTKGHTNEMLGAIFAGGLIGEAYYSLLFGAISVSPLVGRYHDLRQLQDSGQPMPKVSKLNYIYLLFPVAFVLLFVLILIPAIHNAKNHINTTNKNYSNFQTQDNFNQ